jgi:hypothetical protein
MTKLLDAEAIDAINEAVEATLRQHPDANVIEECLRNYLKRRWPHIIRWSAITLETSA